MRYDDGSGLGGIVGPPIAVDEWTHIAMVRDFGKTFFLYVNGARVGELADSGKSLTPVPFKLGRRDVLPQSGFDGAIDDFEICDRALTDEGITDLVSR